MDITLLQLYLRVRTKLCNAYFHGKCQSLGVTEATTVSEHIAPGESQIVESSAGNLGYVSGIWHSTWGAVQLH